MTRKAHIHLWDIPSKYYPRKSKAKLFQKEVLGFFKSLSYTNKKLQHASKIAVYNIKSIHQSSIHALTSPSEVFDSVRDFVYHYENYCYRLFSFRGRVAHFLNVVIPIGYDEKDLKIEHLLINPIIKKGNFLPVLKKFRTNGTLGKLISDRQTLTHRLYYDKNDIYLRPNNNDGSITNKWFKEWEKEIENRAKVINNAELFVNNLCNEVARKVVQYKESLKK